MWSVSVEGRVCVVWSVCVCEGHVCGVECEGHVCGVEC